MILFEAAPHESVEQLNRATSERLRGRPVTCSCCQRGILGRYWLIGDIIIAGRRHFYGSAALCLTCYRKRHKRATERLRQQVVHYARAHGARIERVAIGNQMVRISLGSVDSVSHLEKRLERGEVTCAACQRPAMKLCPVQVRDRIQVIAVCSDHVKRAPDIARRTGSP